MADTTNLVNFEAVTATVPGDASRVLLDRVSLGVSAGDRIGVVGLNGGGKTTMLEVFTGVREPDGGRVSRQRDLRIAVVDQHTELPAGARVRDVVLAPLGVDADSAEHEWATLPQVRTVLSGLGLTSAGGVDLDRSVDGMSGGERRRVALAVALVAESDLIVLDEPTNHLDVEGIAWLAEHLVSRRSGLLVVTHDRWFLDAVCTRTWEVADGRVEAYSGGYADWVYARAERARQSDAAEERRRNLARKELAWLRRGAPARTSKPKFRIEAAEVLIADVPDPRNTPELMAFASARLGRQVLELEDATLRVPDRTLLDRVTWRLGPGDRIGLVGVNGSGKTTLLRALGGERELDGGRLVTGKTVRLAHLTQELVDLPASQRVLEAVEEIARFVTVGRNELTASSMLERLGFPAARQWTPVGELSGGERRRLQLTRLLMAEPNVLLLDEPTNDLDIDTLQRLEDLLDGWPGTLVVVSHDRYLIERVCDTVVALFGDGRITHLPGGIEEYLARRSALQTPVPASPSGATAGGTVAPTAGAPARSAAERRDAQKDVRRLERRLEVLTSREGELHAALAEAATDGPRLLELDAELRALVAERARVEEEWLLAAELAEG
ncbi:MAG TPA: ABC-F family ATP-binding cassette domain-containing protein [Pseudonocardia sp.]|jgi:ATP-binding cassette subfamily F protein uup|uniref:ABC-F family ATP-binding cassette domain-containing protein n=1 Tax=Pseudonocardia sp. TaxID=60912 RepID=UPI002BB491A6|nr:ABC-F family ATP-binding cassette domain-containing protein [Pseudonocardia sp.]HTF54151.1 ABC-F family ATP-binding cassette domain-containing protein [Pseudonocardia sp.]